MERANEMTAPAKTAAETTATTPNLRQTRKEHAAKKAPAKTAPAAKAAPAPTPAAKAPTAPAARKLRWIVEGDRNAKGGKEQSATVDDHRYAITRAGEGCWTASVTVDGKATLLVTEGKFSQAYGACVSHNRARA